jgi:hypothetical protein
MAGEPFGIVARRGLINALILATLYGLAAVDAKAQCLEPTRHFRGGLWKEWVVQILPGPRALEAIQRIVVEMNQGRAKADPPVPQLVFTPDIPLLFSVFEENNPRGPSGAPVADRNPNREVLLGTYALVDGGGPVLILLADPLRTNKALTASGIPGVDAAIERTMKFPEGEDGVETSTRWAVASASDQVKFSLRYSSAAISSRSRFPSAPAYLGCDYGHFVDQIFRSSPAQTYAVYDHSQTSFLFDLTREDIKLHLRIKHHDPEVQAIFNDPDNQPIGLSEADRVIRWQRQ